MFETLEPIHPVLQAFLATLFTWGLTALGAGLVIFFVRIRRKVLDGMLGFAAGVMIAAGAMIFVVIEELVPESQHAGNTDVASMGAMIGFTLMMTLDVALG